MERNFSNSMCWLKPEFNSVLIMVTTLLFAGCSSTPIITEEGYSQSEYIVPRDGFIFISGESPGWNNSRRLAMQQARYNAFHEAMMYVDDVNVKHVRDERTINYVLNSANSTRKGFENYSLVNEARTTSKAIPLRVIARINKVKCYQKQQDLKYRFRCFALVNVIP